MKKLLVSALVLFSVLANGQSVSGPGASWVPPSSTVQNFYLATTGNDSNSCLSGSACLTLAHVLTLIPTTLTRPYQINVSDGTYAEGILFQGWVGSISTGVSIVGNAGTPANVVFSGSVNCTGGDGSTYTSSLCNTANAYLTITGMKFTATVTRGLFVYNGAHLITNNVQVLSAAQYGVECSLSSTIEILGTLLVQNFATGGSGVGIHINLGGHVVQYDASAVTLSSPATSASWGIDINGSATTYEIHSGTATSLSISGITFGVLVKQGSFLEVVGSFTGTLSITNVSTPSGSAGIYTEGGGSVFVNPGTFTLTHFTNCLQQDTWGSITIKAVTFSSCGANSSIGNAGSVNINF